MKIKAVFSTHFISTLLWLTAARHCHSIICLSFCEEMTAHTRSAYVIYTSSPRKQFLEVSFKSNLHITGGKYIQFKLKDVLYAKRLKNHMPICSGVNQSRDNCDFASVCMLPSAYRCTICIKITMLLMCACVCKYEVYCICGFSEEMRWLLLAWASQKSVSFA